MNRLFKIILLCLLVFKATNLKAQNSQSDLYFGVKMGVPLFWGDLYSIGETPHLGIASGLSLGYRPSKLWEIDLNFDYGAGKVGPTQDQLNDFIDQNGIIQYTKGNWQLKEINSQVQFFKIGLRFPLKMLNLLNPNRNTRWNIEVSPQFTINHFSANIYHNNSKRKLTNGAIPKNWSFGFGGDIGATYRLMPHFQLFARSALIWLNEERFEGISSYPAWNVNIMLNTTTGIQIDI